MLTRRIGTSILTLVLGSSLLILGGQAQRGQWVAVAGTLSPDSGTDNSGMPPTQNTAPAASTPVPSGTIFAADSCTDPTRSLFPQSSQDVNWLSGCVDGAYQLESTIPVTFGSPSRFHFVLAPGNYADVAVSADVSLAPNGDAHTAFGLGCRYSGGGATPNGYRMYYVLDAARWNLGRVDAGGFVPLNNGRQAATALSIPLTDSVHLQLTCSGNTIAVSVNGTQVFSIQDSSYQQGRVALTAGMETQVNGNNQIYTGFTGIAGARFSNIVLAQP